MATRTFSQQTLDHLSFVDSSGISCTQTYTIPDFLLIGPQRTGTTWLSRHLVLHPEIFIPAEKELYYFNYLKEGSGNLFQSTKLTWYLKKFNPHFADFIRLNAMNIKMMRSLPKQSLNWAQYKKGRVFGEATASYAAMDSSLISELLQIAPNVKIIMMVRDPVARAWSHAKKDLLKATGKKLDEVSFEVFAEFYQRDYQVRCGQFQEMINLWQNHVGHQNFLLQKFSDIASQPEVIFDEVCRFIGVEPMGHQLVSKGRIVNPTAKNSLPPEHAELLNALFSQEKAFLHDRGLL